MKFKCPQCGNTELCFHTCQTSKTPLCFENGKFEPAGKVEEINIDERKPLIRCGNGHALKLMNDEGYVTDCDDFKYWLAQRIQIDENKD